MMKILGAVIAASVLAIPAARAVPSSFPAAPVTVKFDAFTQATYIHVTGGKTNETATSTNIMTVSVATVSNSPFVNSNLVALVANSFNTSFPAGSQMGFYFGKFVVVDSTGTNIVFDPSSVLSLTNNEEVYAGKVTDVSTLNQNGPSNSGNLSIKYTSDVTITYDDSAQTTRDGQHTQFQLRGLMVESGTVNLQTYFGKVDDQLQVTGGGSIDGVQTILTGTIGAKASGKYPPIF